MAAPANTYLALWMAEAAGFYRANGLDYEIFPMTGGAEAGPTLGAGKIQLMHIGLSSVIKANAAGANLRVIGSLSNVIRFTLFAKPGVAGPAQLKGGVTGALGRVAPRIYESLNRRQQKISAAERGFEQSQFVERAIR